MKEFYLTELLFIVSIRLVRSFTLPGVPPMQDFKNMQPGLPPAEHPSDLSRQPTSQFGRADQGPPSYLAVNMNMMPPNPARGSPHQGGWPPIVRTPEPPMFQPNLPQEFDQSKPQGGASNLYKPYALGDGAVYQEKKSANPFLAGSLSHQMSGQWEQPPLNYASPMDSNWQNPFKAEQGGNGVGVQSMTPQQMGSLPHNYQPDMERPGSMPDSGAFGFQMPQEAGQASTAGQAPYYAGPSPSSFSSPSQDMQSNFRNVQAGYNDLLNAMYPMSQERRGEEYPRPGFETFGTVGVNMYESGLSKEKRANFPESFPFMRFSESDPMSGNVMQAPNVQQRSPDNGSPFSGYPFPPLPQYSPSQTDGALAREGSQVPGLPSNHFSKYRQSYSMPDELMSNGPETSQHYSPSSPFRYPFQQPSWSATDPPGRNPPSSDNNYGDQTPRSEGNDQASLRFFNPNPTSERTADALSPLTLQVRLANSTMENLPPVEGSESYENESDDDFEDKEKDNFQDFKLKKKKESTNTQEEGSSRKTVS